MASSKISWSLKNSSKVFISDLIANNLLLSSDSFSSELSKSALKV